MISRWRVPRSALLLSGGAAIGLVLAAATLWLVKGSGQFYAEADAFHYRLIAMDLFGKGGGFFDNGEAAYRYGRFGLPFLGWLLAFGRPGAVGTALIFVNLTALAAVPGLSATLLEEYGLPGTLGAVAFLPLGLYALYRDPVAEPLMIALILLAFVLDARGRPRRALVVLAYAVLVKEIAALALVPWAWRALRRADWRRLAQLGTVLVPYACWCAWIRFRIGSFPFLSPTIQRTEAFGFPFAGMRVAFNEKPASYVMILGLTVVTVVFAAVAAWIGRGSPLAGLAGAYGFLTLCLGPNALRFGFEIGRLLAPAQVFAVLAIAIAWYERRDKPPAFVSLQRVSTSV